MNPTEYRASRSGMPALVFGTLAASGRALVYLHGKGEFGKGIEGQYEYPGFATALRDDEVRPATPVVLPCAETGGNWTSELVASFLADLREDFGGLGIDLIGYSAGGWGIYNYLMDHDDLRSATVINAPLPSHENLVTGVPLHIIHSREDHLATIEEVKAFCDRLRARGLSVTFSEWPGDHFIIHPVALDPGFYRWIDEAPSALNKMAGVGHARQ